MATGAMVWVMYVSPGQRVCVYVVRQWGVCVRGKCQERKMAAVMFRNRYVAVKRKAVATNHVVMATA